MDKLIGYGPRALHGAGEMLAAANPDLDVKHYDDWIAVVPHGVHLAIYDYGVATCKVSDDDKVEIVLDECSITIDPHGGVMQRSSA